MFVQTTSPLILIVCRRCVCSDYLSSDSHSTAGGVFVQTIYLSSDTHSAAGGVFVQTTSPLIVIYSAAGRVFVQTTSPLIVIVCRRCVCSDYLSSDSHSLQEVCLFRLPLL